MRTDEKYTFQVNNELQQIFLFLYHYCVFKVVLCILQHIRYNLIFHFHQVFLRIVLFDLDQLLVQYMNHKIQNYKHAFILQARLKMHDIVEN